jgi:predicted 3-demethylubiquinone-9 3-methyltransferase (glyoxalase superfamily)
MRHVRTAWPGGSPSVRSSAYDSPPITSDSAICPVPGLTARSIADAPTLRGDEFPRGPSSQGHIRQRDSLPRPRGRTAMPQITPNLWFDTQAEEAANHYISIFPNSRIVDVTHYTENAPREAGMVMTVEFELDGRRFVGINGGPEFTFDEAVSFEISCADQEEIDYYWERLGDGGEHGPCGWLKDRYGLSWQVVPEGMDKLFSDSDPERASRAMQAMLGMRKLDLAALRAAADGVPAS